MSAPETLLEFVERYGGHYTEAEAGLPESLSAALTMPFQQAIRLLRNSPRPYPTATVLAFMMAHDARPRHDARRTCNDRGNVGRRPPLIECNTNRTSASEFLPGLETGAYAKPLSRNEAARLFSMGDASLCLATRPGTSLSDPGASLGAVALIQRTNAIRMVRRPYKAPVPIQDGSRPGEAGFFGRCLSVVSLCVRPELRGRGVGGRLVEWAKKWGAECCRCPLVADLYADDKDAEEYALRSGFRPTYLVPGTGAAAVRRWEWRGDGYTHERRDQWAKAAMRTPYDWPDPEYYTSSVIAMADGIRADDAPDRLPILADALEDAGFPFLEVLGAFRGADGWQEGARLYFAWLFGH